MPTIPPHRCLRSQGHPPLSNVFDPTEFTGTSGQAWFAIQPYTPVTCLSLGPAAALETRSPQRNLDVWCISPDNKRRKGKHSVARHSDNPIYYGAFCAPSMHKLEGQEPVPSAVVIFSRQTLTDSCVSSTASAQGLTTKPWWKEELPLDRRANPKRSAQSAAAQTNLHATRPALVQSKSLSPQPR